MMSSKQANGSLISLLPPEILSIIIAHAVADAFDCTPDSALVVRHPVLQTCHNWRELGHATPQIWSSIKLYPHSNRDWSEMLLTSLRRSQTLPLDLHLATHANLLRQRMFRPPLPDHEWDAVRDELLASTPRWRRVRVDNITLPGWLTSRNHALPLLVSLYLNWQYVQEADMDISSIRIASAAPALSYVRLEGVWPRTIHLLWSRLTHLHADLDYDHHGIDALRECHSLTSLTLDISAYRDDTDLSFFIDLPVLRRLTMLRGATWLIVHLRTPQLQKIVLRDGNELAIRTHCRELLRFAEKKGCEGATITSVEFEAYNDLPDWANLSHLYPSIAHLRFTNYSMDRGDSDLMHTLGTNPDIFLNLVSLAVPQLEVMREFDREGIRGLVDHRVLQASSAGVKLREIEVKHFFPTRLKEHLDGLRATGVALYAHRPVDMRRPPAETDLEEGEAWIVHRRRDTDISSEDFWRSRDEGNTSVDEEEYTTRGIW